MKFLKWILGFVGFVFLIFTLLVTVAIWPVIKEWGYAIMLVFTIGLGAVFAVAIVAIALRVWDWLTDMFANSAHDRQMKKEEYRKSRAEADEAAAKAEREKIEIVTAPAGDQLWIGSPKDSNIVFRPAHLIPGNVNGTNREWTPVQAEFYCFWNEMYGKRSVDAPPVLLDNVVEVMTPALDLILKAERRLIAGKSGSGKSSLAKHIVWREWMNGIPTIPIDPHHEGDSMLGFPVIGAGRNYHQIADVIETLYWAMDGRYKQAAKGHKLAEFDVWHVIIDEFTAIKNWCEENRKEVLKYWQSLVIEARKVNLRITVLGHSSNVEDMGINSAIRGSLSAWETSGGNEDKPGNMYRLVPKGKQLVKSDEEYSHPGPFGNINMEPAIIIDIPEPMKYRARSMWQDGMSPTAIAIELWGKRSGQRVKKIRDWIEE